MVDYARLAATAKRLIDGTGRTVTVVKDTPTVPDSSKPWELTAGETTVSGIGTIVDAQMMGFQRSNGDGVPMDQEICLFAASNDTGEELEEYHKLKDGDRYYGIDWAKRLQPGDTRLLYVFGLKR